MLWSSWGWFVLSFPYVAKIDWVKIYRLNYYLLQSKRRKTNARWWYTTNRTFQTFPEINYNIHLISYQKKYLPGEKRCYRGKQTTHRSHEESVPNLSPAKQWKNNFFNNTFLQHIKHLFWLSFFCNFFFTFLPSHAVFGDSNLWRRVYYKISR